MRNRSMIHWARHAVLSAIFFLPVGCALADAKLEGTHPAQWRVIWTSDPTTTATVSWSTAEPGKKHLVRFRSADGAHEGQVECQRSGRFGTDKSSERLFHHHAELTGLKPSTRYDIVMESDGHRSPDLHFLTAPDEDRPFSLLFGGDSRSGRDARRKMNQMLSRMLRESPDILALAHGGDYINWGTSLSQWSAWMTDYELTSTADGRMLPIIPARGNHDQGLIFNQVFGFPPREGIYYGMSIASQVRFVTLNTSISAAGKQAKWLDGELGEARAKHRWLVVQYHIPAYPAVKSPGSAKQHFVPLFERHHVDLVCEADGHTIKRTVPIRGDAIDPTGVVYVGEGGLGVGQRTPKADRWYLQSPGKTGRGHHVQLLSFDKETLRYKVILLGGELFDEHVMTPRQLGAGG